eukprot:gene7917-12385_t
MSAPLLSENYHSYHNQPQNPEYTNYQSTFSPIPQQARTIVYHVYHPSHVQQDDCGISFLIFFLGFLCPCLWLVNFRYLKSPNVSTRIISYLSTCFLCSCCCLYITWMISVGVSMSFVKVKTN